MLLGHWDHWALLGSPLDLGQTKCLPWASAAGSLPRSKGKARAELRPARRQSHLPHSRSLLLPGRER